MSPQRLHGRFPNAKARLDRKVLDRSGRHKELRFQMLKRRKVLFENLEIHDVVAVFRKKTWRIIQEYNADRSAAGSQTEGDAKRFDGASGSQRVFSDHHGGRVGHGRLCRGARGSVEGHELITTFDHVRENHQSTEGDARIKRLRGNPVLLASVCADKILHPLTGQRQHAGVPEVLYALVDQVEVDIGSFASRGFREGKNRLHMRVSGGCG